MGEVYDLVNMAKAKFPGLVVSWEAKAWIGGVSERQTTDSNG